jgi:hypothetical protein
VPISHGDAMSSKQKLNEYVMQHTETFGVSLCPMLDDVERILSSLTKQRESQADTRALFVIGTQKSGEEAFLLLVFIFYILKRLCVEFQLSIPWFWAFTITVTIGHNVTN